jgi:hypothetical protein
MREFVAMIRNEKGGTEAVLSKMGYYEVLWIL